MKQDFLETGRILNTHGVHGEVKLESWADTPEALASLETLYLDGKPLRVSGARVHGRFVLAKLEGVDSVEAAMALKGKVVLAARGDLALPEGAVFVRDLIGLRAFSEEGQDLGVVADVLDYPAGRVYVLRGETERLIPENGGFLRDIDVEAGRLTVRLIEGL